MTESLLNQTQLPSGTTLLPSFLDRLTIPLCEPPSHDVSELRFVFPEGTFLPNPESDALIGPVGRNTTKHSEQLSISIVGTIQPGRGDLQAEGPG